MHVTLAPGRKTAMHEHPDNVVVALADAKTRFTGENGKAIDAELKSDQALWSPAGKHSSENIGTAPADVVVIELKGKRPPTAMVPTSRPDMAISPFFDNPRATAFKATTQADFHEPAGTTHDFDQVVVALGSGDLYIKVEGGASKTQWKRGDTLFIGRGTKHESKNTSGKSLDVITVAIK
jgi:quercetin dioxygenase-like cupin family protein